MLSVKLIAKIQCCVSTVMQLLLSWTQLALYSHTLVLLCNATPQKLQIFLVPALKSADCRHMHREQREKPFFVLLFLSL